MNFRFRYIVPSPNQIWLSNPRSIDAFPMKTPYFVDLPACHLWHRRATPTTPVSLQDPSVTEPPRYGRWWTTCWTGCASCCARNPENSGALSTAPRKVVPGENMSKLGTQIIGLVGGLDHFLFSQLINIFSDGLKPTTRLEKYCWWKKSCTTKRMFETL